MTIFKATFIENNWKLLFLCNFFNSLTIASRLLGTVSSLNIMSSDRYTLIHYNHTTFKMNRVLLLKWKNVNDQSILNSLCFEKKHFHNVPLVKSEYLVYKVDRIWKRNINFRKAINIAPGIVRCQRQIKSTLQVSKVISICGLLARTRSISSIQGGVGCGVLWGSGLGRALFLTRYWPQTTGQSGVRHATLGCLNTDLSLLYSCRVNHPYLCSNMKTFWYDNRQAFLLQRYLNSNIIN